MCVVQVHAGYWYVHGAVVCAVQICTWYSRVRETGARMVQVCMCHWCVHDVHAWYRCMHGTDMCVVQVHVGTGMCMVHLYALYRYVRNTGVCMVQGCAWYRYVWVLACAWYSCVHCTCVYMIQVCV